MPTSVGKSVWSRISNLGRWSRWPRGFTAGKDAQLGKKTVLSHFGVDDARARLAKLEMEAVLALEIFGERALTLNDAARFIVRRSY